MFEKNYLWTKSFILLTSGKVDDIGVWPSVGCRSSSSACLLSMNPVPASLYTHRTTCRSSIQHCCSSWVSFTCSASICLEVNNTRTLGFSLIGVVSYRQNLILRGSFYILQNFEEGRVVFNQVKKPKSHLLSKQASQLHCPAVDESSHVKSGKIGRVGAESNRSSCSWSTKSVFKYASPWRFRLQMYIEKIRIILSTLTKPYQ